MVSVFYLKTQTLIPIVIPICILDGRTNGLQSEIKQWGVSSSLGEYGDYTAQYPLKYKSNLFAIYIQQANNQNNVEYTNSVWVKNRSTTSFVLCNGAYGNTSYWWLSIGMQQWGYLVHSGTTTGQTVNFNITFPTACYSVVASRTDSGATSYWTFVIHTDSVTTNKFQCHLANNLYWIAFGKQQWGKTSSSGRATTTVTLPIAMTSAIYAVVISQAAASDTWSTWSSIVSNTQIKLTNNYGPGSWWFVTGKQQWGEFLTTSSQFATYPLTISMSNNLYHIFGNHIGITQSTYAVIFGDKTLNNFQCKSGVSNQIVNWIILGYQQWGQCYGYKSSKLTNFPISFTTTKFIEIAGTTYVSELLEMPVCSLRFDDSLTTIRTGANSGTTSTIGVGTYIVLGIQQWGYSTARTATFPIAFSSQIYAAVVCPNTNSTSATATGAYSLTLTGMGIYVHGTKGWYFVVGKQQWGTFQDGTNWDKYFSFPIAFSTACYASCVADIYDGDKNEDVYFRAKPTTTQFRLRVGAGFNCPHLVIAIGKQQWGENATAKPATATLPMSCNIVVSAMANYIGTKGSEYATLIYGTSTTTLSVIVIITER